MRRGLLGQFPADVPLTVFTADASPYESLAAGRALTILPLGGTVPAPVAGNVIIDGLDAIDAPAGALRALRDAAPEARLFALVANAAYAPALARFLAGEPAARDRPLVAADLEPFFASAGWRAVDRIPLIDRRAVDAAIPYTLAAGDVTFTITSGEMAERMGTAGFLVVADPA